MNIALIGYGRMGHEIEAVALSRGHSIKLIIDQDNFSDLDAEHIKGINAAIEFTAPEAALGNVIRCLGFKIPVVSGTTGWLEDLEKAKEKCIENGTSFIHSSNFSIGVNILYRLNSELAKLLEHLPEYRPFIEEKHHTLKIDAPSGTAITLAYGIIHGNNEYTGWCFEDEKKERFIPVRSVREGMVPGIHTVIWDSDADIISLKHEAKSRKGLAYGAVLAAEYIHLKKGIFTMNDVLGF